MAVCENVRYLFSIFTSESQSLSVCLSTFFSITIIVSDMIFFKLGGDQSRIVISHS